MTTRDTEPNLWAAFATPTRPDKAPKDTHGAKRTRVAEPGRNAVLDYLLARVGQEVSKKQLEAVTGHDNIDGRIGELRRDHGYQIACGKRTDYSEALGLHPDDGSQLYCLLSPDPDKAVKKHIGLVLHYTEEDGATFRNQKDVTGRLSPERREEIAQQVLRFFAALVEQEPYVCTLTDEDFQQ